MSDCTGLVEQNQKESSNKVLNFNYLHHLEAKFVKAQVSSFFFHLDALPPSIPKMTIT